MQVRGGQPGASGSRVLEPPPSGVRGHHLASMFRLVAG